MTGRGIVPEVTWYSFVDMRPSPTVQLPGKTFEGPFQPDALVEVDRFRKMLKRAGYTAEGLRKLKREIKSNDGVDLALLERRTSAVKDSFQCFARLFFLGRPVPVKAFENALPSFSPGQLLDCGLIREEKGCYCSTARIECYQDLLICSDFVHFGLNQSLASDHVLGVGPGAISLAALTPRGSVESALDLGTGGGIQAILASRHAERVVATDICERALSFAAMNAKLNAIVNIDFRHGSFYEPVTGERFDLLIANPPFVISPGSRFVYRDGGLEGDAVSEHVVRDAAAHLKEGGFAAVLLNWHHQTVDDWADRPQSWTDGNGCNARWIRFDDEDPLSYAASWLRQEEKRDEQTAGKLLDEWVDYYERAGMRRIALGAVLIQKRSGIRNWVRCDDIPIDISLTACGEQVRRIFDAEDLISSLDDERELLDQFLMLHPGHRIDQSLIIHEGSWSVQSNRLHITDGMDFCANLDVQTMRFLSELDGSRTVREAAMPIAESLGRDFEDVVPICLNMTRRLLRNGLLIPVTVNCSK